MKKSIRCPLAMVVGLATAWSAINPSLAGPLPVMSAAVKTSAPSDLVNVRNRRGAIVAGAALGIIGAAIAASAADRYHYGYYGPVYYYPPPFAYYPPVYYPPYAYYGGYWGAPYWGGAPYAYRVYPRYRYHAFRGYRLHRHWR